MERSVNTKTMTVLLNSEFGDINFVIAITRVSCTGNLTCLICTEPAQLSLSVYVNSAAQ